MFVVPDLAYDDKDAKTMREYAYIVRRFVHFLQSRGRDLLDATESDLTAYRVMRTELQDKPVGDAAWAKEAQLINQLYQWLVDQGHLRHRPLRMNRKGRNPLASRVRRGMDIRHMTLAQYRYFRDVGLGGQLPNSQASNVFRGRAPIRNRAAADLRCRPGCARKSGPRCSCPNSGSGGAGLASPSSSPCRHARNTASTARSTCLRPPWTPWKTSY